MTRTSQLIRSRVRSTVAGAVGAALVCAATLGVVGSTTASGAQVLPHVSSCTTAGLVEWIDTQGNGALGTIYYQLEFTNLSGHACTLRGYPGVSGVNLAGGQLGSAAVRGGPATVRTITIGAGKSATATLGIVEALNFPAAQCHPTTAAGLRVYAPNQTVAKVVPFPFSACAKAGEPYLNIAAVTTP